jgi:hypothetical protein
MRRVCKPVGGNDKSASHATRVAGTENFKTKYIPAFPEGQGIAPQESMPRPKTFPYRRDICSRPSCGDILRHKLEYGRKRLA